jgi:ATP-binding cassette subfamily B protein
MPDNSYRKRAKFILPYVRRYKFSFMGGILLVIISTALDQVSPWMVKIILDNLASGKAFNLIYTPLLLVFLAAVFSAVLLYFQRMWVIQASRKIEYEMRDDLFRSLQAQPKIFFDKQSTGDLMSNATNDLDRVRDYLGIVILHLARMICLGIFTLTAVWMLHPMLAVLGIIPSVILPLFVNRLLKKMHQLYGYIQKNLGTLNSFIQDTMSGIQVVKAYAREDVFKGKFEKLSNNLRINSLKVAFFTSGLWPFIGLLGALGILLVVWFGARMVIQEVISIGTLSAALLYLLKLQFPMAGLGWIANLMQRSNAAMDRLLELENKLSAAEDTVSQASPVAPRSWPPGLSREQKCLTLRRLYFRYEQGPEVLHDVNLTIPFGTTLGIVGPIGSGKSTLMHLLCGVYTPPPRTLYLAGRPREAYSSEEWKSWFSLSPQDGFLFSQSIRDNIAMGQGPNPVYSVEEAGDMAGFTRDLPQIQSGYDTLLGERGINLSGGQRQRVGLAKALLCNAEILCLDDSLSALDSETEIRVLENLRKRFVNYTLIIISHRYSAVVGCDNIVFLGNGTITETGTHRALLERDGPYAQVYKKQMMTMDLEKH